MKKRQSQSELIKQMSGKQVRQSVFLSQLLFVIIAVVASLFIFPNFLYWFDILELNLQQILIYGVPPALVLVIIEILLFKVVSKEALDDGGINEKVFKDASVGTIFILALVVAISEELLFRGLLQTTFGLIIASGIFAIIHVRYLKKPILFIFVVLTSFLIGYLFELTNNLLVVIVFHFALDFLLGLFIKYRKD